MVLNNIGAHVDVEIIPANHKLKKSIIRNKDKNTPPIISSKLRM